MNKIKSLENIPKKPRQAKQKAKIDAEAEDWKRLGEEEMLKQYSEDDSAYDNIKL